MVKKRKYSYDRCPNPVYFNTPLLFIYLSAIESRICHRKIEGLLLLVLQKKKKYDGPYKYRFSKYCTELIVALSSTNVTKMSSYGDNTRALWK